MGKKLYVGNMNYDTNDARLREVFGEYGEVTDVYIVINRDTGRSRGFAFVEMSTDEQAKAAVTGLNGKNVDGRELRVDEARPRRSFNDGGGRGGGGGYNRGGGGYNNRGGGGNRYNDNSGW